jgi:hypothetical protein
LPRGVAAARRAALRAALPLLRCPCRSAAMLLLLVPRRAVPHLLAVRKRACPLPCCPHRRLDIYGTAATQAVLDRRCVCVVRSVCARVALVVSAAPRQDEVALSSSFPPLLSPTMAD